MFTKQVHVNFHWQWVASRVENTNQVNLWMLAKQFGLDELKAACLEFVREAVEDGEVVQDAEKLCRNDDLATILALPKISEQVGTFKGHK